MFIEVFILNAISKTPVALNSTDNYSYNYYLSLEILDPTGQKIFSSFAQGSNSTSSFIYKIPKTAPGGEYTI
jgi:hypothetical protein